MNFNNIIMNLKKKRLKKYILISDCNKFGFLIWYHRITIQGLLHDFPSFLKILFFFNNLTYRVLFRFIFFFIKIYIILLLVVMSVVWLLFTLNSVLYRLPLLSKKGLKPVLSLYAWKPSILGGPPFTSIFAPNTFDYLCIWVREARSKIVSIFVQLILQAELLYLEKFLTFLSKDLAFLNELTQPQQVFLELVNLNR